MKIGFIGLGTMGRAMAISVAFARESQPDDCENGAHSVERLRRAGGEPMLDAVHGQMRKTVEAGLGDQDWSVMAKLTLGER